MSKFISITLTLIIFIISIYYTTKIINISKDKDPIMIEIKNYKSNYKTNKEEAIIDNEYIIPGKKGTTINVDKSYSLMKKIGKFDTKLLVFEELKPTISINNTYDNYIIKGNKKNPSVSIIVLLEDTSYIEDLLKILNQKDIKVTFFISKELFDNSTDILKLIKGFGHEIELLSDNYSVYEVNKYSSILRLISESKLSFCLFYNKNNDILNNCKTSKLHSVIPSIITDKYLYNSVKNNLENGSIISITNNKNTIRELSSTVNYIHQKGKKIVLLKNLIEE